MIFANVNDDRLNFLEKELKDAKNIKWYKRLMIIQLSSQGKTVKQLAKDFNVCQASIRDYIKRYNTGDLQTLRRQDSNGRPHKIKLTKTQWEELLHQSPCQPLNPPLKSGNIGSWCRMGIAPSYYYLFNF